MRNFVGVDYYRFRNSVSRYNMRNLYKYSSRGGFRF